MARLLTIINERNKIKNEFLQLLEFWYIQTTKKEEEHALKIEQEAKAEKDKLNGVITLSNREQRLERKNRKIRSILAASKIGTKSDNLLKLSLEVKANATSKENVAKALSSSKANYDESKHQKLNKINITPEAVSVSEPVSNTAVESDITSGNKPVLTSDNPVLTSENPVVSESPSTEPRPKVYLDSFVRILTKEEERMADSLSKRFTKHQLLHTYVKNPQLLSPKDKRIVIAKIGADRAKSGKMIFMKEMAAISYQLKSLNQNVNPQINKLENL